MESDFLFAPPKCVSQTHIGRASILSVCHPAYILMIQDRLTVCVPWGICAVTSILTCGLNVAYIPVASTDCTLTSCFGDIPIGIDAEHLVADFRC